MNFFSFRLLIGLGGLLGHAYVLRHLWRIAPGRWARASSVAVVGCFSVLLLLRNRLGVEQLGEANREAVQRLLYGWLGLLLCVVLAFTALDLLRLVRFCIGRLDLARAARKGGAPEVDPARRALLMRAAGAGAGLAGAGLAGYGSFRAFQAPELTEVVVRLPRLPASLEGLSIVQLTDIHVGPFVKRRFMDALVEQTNALKPDLVAVTGDLVDGSVSHLGDSVAALGNLRARYGSFFVTGNHEYYSGELEWVAFVERLGLRVLRNRTVSIGDGGGRFELSGVDDWAGGKRRGRPGYDLERALLDRDPDRASVLLAHQPANWEIAAARGVDLQISGHTHGGQMFPMTALIGLEWKHSAGLYREGDAQLFVSRGCGFWGPPMRVGSPPELVKLVLTRNG